MTGLCRALLRDTAEAEDAAQQTFLSAHRALVNGSSPEEPAAWLATIARNECWSRIRNRMREPLPTGDIDQEASSSDPLAEAIRNADLAAMWSAIAELPRQQRDALLLREFGGLSYEELAGALAVSGPAVESLLFRARQGVRVRLKTAYAGVTGASWLESLARLAGGLGGGMAPVAAKVAAVGVGAAVATGGAVVGPRMLDHSTRGHQVVRRHVASVATPQIAVQPVRTSHVAAPTLASLRRPTAQHAGGGSSHDDTASIADDHSSRGDSHGSKGEDRSIASEHARESDDSSGSTVKTSTTRRNRQVETPEADRPESDSSPGDQSPSSSAPADNGGVAPTTTNPVVTVTVAMGDAPPTLGGSTPPDGG
ncbi:MAG: sigma-70 family polymerase sigma factor [Actinomycetia bacterium]|nr:sigma-70 family polymerase sigma factor [Actinomycetes bacterium]